jgi:hypothetical protein
MSLERLASRFQPGTANDRKRRRAVENGASEECLEMPHSSPFDWGGETGDPWPLLTEFQTGGLSNAKN